MLSLRRICRIFFDLYGLFSFSHKAQLFRACSELIPEPAPPPLEQAKIESSAEYLYGLIHARFVLTSAGLNAVLEKYYNSEYGRCPRVYCKDQPVLPAAVSDIPHEEAVKVSCHTLNCYRPSHSLNHAFTRTSTIKATG